MRVEFLRGVKGDGRRFAPGDTAPASDFPAEVVKWWTDAGFVQPVVETPPGAEPDVPVALKISDPASSVEVKLVPDSKPVRPARK